ncbi:GH36-type glycosyl hydrolase domain-containing protein [Haloplasma contractile]|uniref:Cellobiose phosphorylase protein n=1 Tax=Haloplasma contractile SSD-17B TaxID=1033810 RepID=F7PWG4_9MOLU|nr:cellobiose phosphorylase [Haloplasma contractile]ERJ11884.1 Cellobiose phosphorylase protein [Haloplasma contractile SSD-17B]
MNKCKFKEKNETFTLDNAKDTSYLYFPITNGFKLKSSVNSQLNGDLKLDQNQFAMVPVSQEDLQNNLFGRHFWMNINGFGLYNASGVSAVQKVRQDDDVSVEAGFLYHKTTRTNDELRLSIELTTFSPYGHDNVELTKVTIQNSSEKPLTFTPTVAIPLYSRSADNLRDHRHVTALLNRAKVVQNGIINQPSLSFDERGHQVNHTRYGVFATTDTQEAAKAYYPKLQEFVGEGGSLDWPKSLLESPDTTYQVGDDMDGFEVNGGIGFAETTLAPQETKSYVMSIVVSEDEPIDEMANQYTVDMFDQKFDEMRAYWSEKMSSLSIQTGDSQFDQYVKWVSLQPILRRIFGCSFLPHHDYGRGGRGWRDLWQDCLALLLTEPEDVEYLLYNNYLGVKIDGTNATIIGSEPGEFVADRNNIPRVWMDHGAWPWNTTKLYLERSGNYDFLFRTQGYFKDKHVHFTRTEDETYDESQGTLQKDKDGNVYEGTILEHILLQNLVQYYNVGEHNNMRLEGADWNDGLDMAKDKGESVTFTAFYAMNLMQISEVLTHLKEQGLSSIEVLEEMRVLLTNDISFDDIEGKHETLNKYFNLITSTVSGKKATIKLDELISTLKNMSEAIRDHLRNKEWLKVNDNTAFYNGYYDNKGNKLEGVINDHVRMTLTGQVFPLMSDIATSEQTKDIIASSKELLYDQKVGGYRLNNNYNEVKLDMGRLFGFAFGHKENGAMFSHMAMMFANALYQQGETKEATSILEEIYEHCMDFDTSKIYPGIPEYIDPDGRGMYHYLTGSASWFILNVVNEMFGVKGHYGKLHLKPSLLKHQFNADGKASISTLYRERKVTITYTNVKQLSHDDYQIKSVLFNNEEVPFEHVDNGVIIDPSHLNDDYTDIEVILDEV